MKSVQEMTSRFNYDLCGPNSEAAVRKRLAEAVWYQTPVARDAMRKLLERRNGPGMRDCFIWFGLMAGCAWLTVFLWGSWPAFFPYMLYAVLYGSTSDSRWHESSHGTVFKTDWLNNVLYEVSSFMVMRESTVWRWSHTRHHSDTIVVGRDPEIAVPRPVQLFRFILNFTGLPAVYAYVRKILKHSTGNLFDDERTYIPEYEHGRIIWKARAVLLIYAGCLGCSWYYQTVFPLLFIGLPNLAGAWLMPVYGLTQHTGLAENVLDHRKNCRTVQMNRVNRFLYWNMNYHIEHHMFPQVPYYNLPKLHELVRHDMPSPIPGFGMPGGKSFRRLSGRAGIPNTMLSGRFLSRRLITRNP
ncbi:fatty acid desaturase [Verrucomicrobia bacterium S94]|nr:fatty acid desaturase [Verrucomicrobia bacterium S94]